MPPPITPAFAQQYNIKQFVARFKPSLDLRAAHSKLGIQSCFMVLIFKLLVTTYGALVLASLVSRNAKCGVRKIHSGLRATIHLLSSNEKKWSKDVGEGATRIFGDGWHVSKTKTIVFIRHGESTWNEVFNRGFFAGATLPLRLIKGLIIEAVSFFSDDSFFLDSPLSALGIRQATELRKFFTKEKALREAGNVDRQSNVVDVIVGVRGRSVIVSSNLRRAVNTTVNALWCRLQGSQEKVLIHSALQEIARNVDTYALASRKGDIVPTQHLAKELGTEVLGPSEMFDASANAGQKAIGRKGIDSLREFAAWSMNEPAEVIIAGGHSIWFREFFMHFLPSDSKCEGKKKKIINCGVIAFDLKFGTHPNYGEMYAIDPSSVKIIFGGFDK